MHVLLTDVLTCPRCGPTFGLILQADRWEDRQVEKGWLGCANCRESFPISGGVADLRHPLVSPLPASDGEAVDADTERAFRAAALLGVTDMNPTVLMVDAEGQLAGEVADVLKGAHVIGAGDSEAPLRPTGDGILSSLRVGERIPLRDRSLRGVALLGTVSPALLAEAGRVLYPGARLVVDPAPVEVANSLREMGFDVHLEQNAVVVASAPRHP
jgi:uncharacterized protein YbaR (Trm112 family)